MKRFSSTVLLGVMLALPGWLGAQAQPAPQWRPIPGGSFLGIGIQQITSDRAKELKLPGDGGVEVTRVSPDSPADKAGIKVGDVVLQYNGTHVDGIEQLSRLVHDTPVGREVKIDISRNGAMQTVTARIAEHPAVPFGQDGSNRPPDISRVIPGLRSPMLGIEAEPVDGQLAQFFGVKEGVLVRSVMRNSAAEKAGLKAGDVITRIDDTVITTPADISNHLRSTGPKTLPLILTRDHREMTITVSVEVPKW